MNPTRPGEHEVELREGARQLLERLTGEPSVTAEFDLVRVSGGGNNRVYRLEVRDRSTELGPAGCAPLLLKSYFRDVRDTRNRAETEHKFLEYAWSVGVRSVPQPLACDSVAGLALMECVDGARVSHVGDVEVRESLAFLRALNRFREAAASLANAAESCFTLSAHVDVVDARVNRLANSSSEWTCPEVMDFLVSRLVPQWISVRDDFRVHSTESGIAFEAELPVFERILSPSDFGFHNALRTPAGPLTFIDFEYAGWDDPAKLVCDFFTQPELPVPGRYLGSFVDVINDVLDLDTDRSDSLRSRVDLLLPIYRVKWCCILLNELSPAGRARREFSGDQVDEERIHAQLDKAVSMLETVSS